jgi:hypothetical protein
MGTEKQLSLYDLNKFTGKDKLIVTFRAAIGSRISRIFRCWVARNRAIPPVGAHYRIRQIYFSAGLCRERPIATTETIAAGG